MVNGNSLEERFQELEAHRGFSGDNSIKIKDEKEVYGGIRKAILGRFYQVNIIAGSVSKMERSYSDAVVGIVSNYDSRKKRCSLPTLNEENDEIIQEVITSMNGVSERCFDQRDYTSKGRRAFVSESHFKHGVTGIISGVALGLSAYFTNSFGVGDETIANSVLYGSVALPFISSMIIGRLRLNKDMKEKLRSLSVHAGYHEDFLRMPKNKMPF